MSTPNNPLDNEVSEDLRDLYSHSSLEESDEAVNKYINEIVPALSKAEADTVLQNLDSEISSELVFSADEGHVYYTAFEYYKELAKAARKYNKFICKQTRQKLSGKRILKNPSLGVKWSATFNPFIYELTLRTPVFTHPGDLVPDDTKVITYKVTASTNEEAHLRMATHLGFSREQRDSVAFKFHPATIQRIKENPKYLETVRSTQESQEQIKQIQEADYVPVDRRKVWLLEIDEKIQKLKQELEQAS